MGELMSPVFIRRSFTTPNSALNIHRNNMPMRNPDTAHGKKIMA
jgi:hypothetical protein